MSRSDVERVREETAKLLGNDVDLSYITEELLEEMQNAEPVAEDLAWPIEINTLTANAGMRWRDNCTLQPWRSYGGTVYWERLPNCANGLLHYRIRPAKQKD